MWKRDNWTPGLCQKKAPPFARRGFPVQLHRLPEQRGPNTSLRPAAVSRPGQVQILSYHTAGGRVMMWVKTGDHRCGNGTIARSAPGPRPVRARSAPGPRPGK